MYYDANKKLSTHEADNAEANWWQQYSSMEEEKCQHERKHFSFRNLLSTSMDPLNSNFFNAVVKKSQGICMLTLIINIVGLSIFLILQRQFLTDVYYAEKMQSNIYFWLIINVCVLSAMYVAKYHPGSIKTLSKRNKSFWWLTVSVFVIMVLVVRCTRYAIVISQFHAIGLSKDKYAICGLLSVKSGNDHLLNFTLTLLSFIFEWFQMALISVQPFPFPCAPTVLTIQIVYMMYSIGSCVQQEKGNLAQLVFVDLERLCVGAIIFISISVKEHENSSLQSSKNLFLIQRSLRQISKFIDIICTEMKLPLTYVRSGLEYIDLQQVSTARKLYHQYVSNSVLNFNIVTLLCDDILLLTKIEEGRYTLMEGPNVNFVDCFNIAKRNAFAGIDFGIKHKLKTKVDGPKHLIISDKKSLILMLENLLVHAKNVIDEMKNFEMSESNPVPSYLTLSFCLDEDLSNLDSNNSTCPATFTIQVISNYSNSNKRVKIESTNINLCTSLTNIFGGSYEISDNGQDCTFNLPCRAMVDRAFSDEMNLLSDAISTRITEDMLNLKVCVLKCPNGFESCLTNMFDTSFHFSSRYTVSSLGSHDIEKFNVFDVVFTEDLKLCEKLKAKQMFRGEVVFFHAKLAYMSQDDYEGVCDSKLSAPCSLSDLVNIFEMLLVKKSNQGSVNHDDKYKHLPLDNDRNKNAFNNSSSNSSSSSSGSSSSNSSTRSKSSNSGGSSGSNSNKIGRAPSRKVKHDITFGKQFDYLPNTFMFMPYFRPNVQESYFLWRNLNPTSNTFYAKSLVVNMKLTALIIASLTKINNIVGENASSRFVNQEYNVLIAIIVAAVILLFRSTLYKYVLGPHGISLSSFFNCIGMFLLILNISVFPYCFYKLDKVSGNWTYTRPDVSVFKSFDSFIVAHFGNLTGMQILLHLVDNNAYISGWLVPWSWVFIVILTVTNIARSTFLVTNFLNYLIAYQLKDPDSLHIWNFYLVYLIVLYGILCLLISYRFEYLYREEFKFLRKTLYSDYFMKGCMKVWSEDIMRPLNSILDSSKTVQPVHELVKERLRYGHVTLDDKFFRTWSGFNFGVILLHGFRNQIKYKESLMDESEGRIVLSDVFKLTSMALTREIFSIASMFGDINLTLDNNIDIHIKVDPLLTVVSCDLTMFRTVFINAVYSAFKNVKYATTINKYNIAQSINIQVSVCDAVKECEQKSDRMTDQSRPTAGLLSFNEARLMKFRIFDTGCLDGSTPESDANNPSDSIDDDYSAGSHENMCQDIIHRCCKMFQCCPKQCTFNNHFRRCDIRRRGGVYNCLQEFTVPFKYNPMSVKARKDAELMSMNEHISTKKDRDKYKQKYKMWRDKNDNLKNFGHSNKKSIHQDRKYRPDIEDTVAVGLTNTFSIMILIFAAKNSSVSGSGKSNGSCNINRSNSSINTNNSNETNEELYNSHLLDRAKYLQSVFESYYWNCSFLICNENTIFGPSIESADCLLIDIKSYEALDSKGCLEITDKIQLLGYLNVIAGLGNTESSDPFLDQRLHLDDDAKLILDGDNSAPSSSSSLEVDASMKSLIKKCNSRLYTLLMGDHEGKGIFRSIFRDVDNDVDKAGKGHSYSKDAKKIVIPVHNHTIT